MTTEYDHLKHLNKVLQAAVAILRTQLSSIESATRAEVIEECVKTWERESQAISILGYKPNRKQVSSISKALRALSTVPGEKL